MAWDKKNKTGNKIIPPFSLWGFPKTLYEYNSGKQIHN